MSVLRENQDVIVTVIEVLLYDPCYEWTLTEEKAAQLQNQSKLTNDCSNSRESNYYYIIKLHDIDYYLF